MQGLVLELLEGQGNLTLNSEAELKNFTIALLKVENNKPLSFLIYLQVVDTLHACNVIHGDIKLSNLVYDRQCNTVKLIDFAFSEILVGRD
jgi:serine/threonine protein kinase